MGTPLGQLGKQVYAYSHHMTSYLEAVGAVFKAYNRHCQLTRVLCAEYNISRPSAIFRSSDAVDRSM